jgi:VIT1/CCC1 family predicted Fe2+/Mn2+ transporter
MASRPPTSRRGLQHWHAPSAISERLEKGRKPSYLGDAVLGAVDGTVTTFAVVASAAGAGLGAGVALVVGLANVVADGFSMAAGNALRAKADHEILAEARAMEERHVDEVPEGEREEVRQIFAAKGFEGRPLEDAVEIVTSDRKRWVDLMLTEELGLRLDPPDPFRAGAMTFVAFVVAGMIPLLPLLAARWFLPTEHAFAASVGATALTFFAVGWIKGVVLGRGRLRGGLETLLLGGAAASLAWAVGNLVGGLAHA